MLTPARPILRYHGGKWRLAPWIISHFPPHQIYVEPFGGAASVLLQKKRAKTEVWNDLNQDLDALFRLLREPESCEQLMRMCWATPFSRSEFDLSYQASTDELESCRRFIVRSFFGYGSKGTQNATRNGFRCLRTGDASPAVDWMRYPPVLQQVATRMRGVVLENKPALDVIRRFDRKETLFYVDPPYVHSVRNLVQGKYVHEMTDTEHTKLAEALHAVKGMVLISGYASPLYNDLYTGWGCVKVRAYADKASPREECLWISPNAAKAAPQLNMLEVCHD